MSAPEYRLIVVEIKVSIGPLTVRLNQLALFFTLEKSIHISPLFSPILREIHSSNRTTEFEGKTLLRRS